MNIQTETAIKIFNDIYGYPKWQKEAKDGQNYEEIIKLWDGELKDYTVQQVKTACYHIIKYRKNMTYPTISHLLAELVDEEKVDIKEHDAQRCLKNLLAHNPPFSEKVIQWTMWKLYKFKYNGYEPEEEEKND